MQKIFRLIPFVILVAGLAACGGGSSTSSTSSTDTQPLPGAPATVAPSTAKFTVLLTDAPSPDWDQAIATITSIELIGNNGIQTLFSGSEAVDLLSLPDFYDVFAISDGIEPDTFSKIRLHVDQLELIQLNEDGSVAQNVLAQLVGGGKIDLRPQRSFYAGPGDSLFIEIDFDVHKTFKTTTTGNGKTIVRPVIKVEITREEPVGRLTRLQGFIGEIEIDEQRFTLCQSELVATMDSRYHEAKTDATHDHDHYDDRGCVVVETDELTGLFGADGMPIGFDALEPDLALTAVGRLQRSHDDYEEFHRDDDDDEDEDKDKDQDNKDSDNSPASNDKDKNKQAGDWDEHHYRSHKVHADLVLQAVAIEVGDAYKRVAGLADDIVAGDTFGLALTPGQNLGTDEAVLPTQLFELTRIFSVDGTELDSTAIMSAVAILADGVLVTSETGPDMLRAALLILDLDAGDDEQVLRGSIITVNFDAGTFQLLVDDMERCINANDADVFVVSNVDGFSSTRAGLGGLQAMQSVDVFGMTEDDSGCFVATDILASEIIANTIPVAEAGEDQTVPVGESVMLDGSDSSDPDDDTLTFLWELVTAPEGSTAELSAADTAMPSLTTDTAGDYVIELIVNDGDEDSAPDSVTVTATTE